MISMLIFLLTIVDRVVLKAIMCFIGENWSLLKSVCIWAGLCVVVRADLCMCVCVCICGCV